MHGKGHCGVLGLIWGHQTGMELSHGCLDQAGSEMLPAPKTPLDPWMLEPPPGDIWGFSSWWGTFSAGPAAWLTPSWLSMLGFELSLP